MLVYDIANSYLVAKNNQLSLNDMVLSLYIRNKRKGWWRHWRRCSPVAPHRRTSYFPARSHDLSGPRMTRSGQSSGTDSLPFLNQCSGRAPNAPPIAPCVQKEPPIC